MKQNRAFSTLAFFIIFGTGAALAYFRYNAGANGEGLPIAISAFLFASLVATSIHVANQWDRAVMLRLGQFHALRGPGLFFIIPVFDAIPYWIDIRVLPSRETKEDETVGISLPSPSKELVS